MRGGRSRKLQQSGDGAEPISTRAVCVPV